jgi:hypothetical protein
MDFKKLNYSDISHEISKVLCVNKNGVENAVLLRSTAVYPKGTRFYRVRTLSSDDHYIPLKEITSQKDIWNPPKEVVGLGRLNREYESLLYTSPINPSIAIEEMKIEDNSNFVLAVFESIAPVNVCNMATASNLDELTSEENIKHKLLNDFLVHEFIRDVGKDTQYLYRISETIMKDYYDLPSEFQDGWCYPSVAQKNSFNVCFRENQAKIKLKFVGVQLATKQSQDNGMIIRPKLIGISKNMNDPFCYYSIGSKEQIDLFPEIQCE